MILTLFEQMNKGRMEILAVQNVRVHIYSGWGQKWYIIMWQYCINTGTLNVNILLDKIKYSGNATNKTSHLILRWRQPRKLKFLNSCFLYLTMQCFKNDAHMSQTLWELDAYRLSFSPKRRESVIVSICFSVCLFAVCPQFSRYRSQILQIPVADNNI